VVVAHNAKFDCGFIYANYGVLLRNWWCTQVASQIITNGKYEFIGKHSLPEVIERYLNVKLEFSENKKLLQKSFTSQYSIGDFTAKQLRYAADDVKYLIPLYQKQSRAIENLTMKAISQLEMKLIGILAKMEIEGCLVDKENWRKLVHEQWEPELEEIERRLDVELGLIIPNFKSRRKAVVTSLCLFDAPVVQTISNDCINYASSAQLVDIFKLAGEQVPTTADGKESCDEITLTTYVNERPNSRLKPFIKVLLEYREVYKRISTYGEKFLAQLDKNNFIHTAYTQTFTATGRLSSKAPNLQNIPAPQKGKAHTDIRRFFISRPGYSLITCDMSSAEVRIAADYSGEELLLDSLFKGADMHSELASLSFSIIFGEPITITKSEEPIEVKGQTVIPVELRDKHKSVVFAKFYKAGAKRIYSVLAEYINMFHSEEDRLDIAGKISKALDTRMPKLSKYLTGLIEKAQREGFLRTSKLGRIRFFDSEVYGEAANAPIQGTNAEAIKIAMIKAYELFEEHPEWDARVVMNVHDELVCEALDEYAEVVAKEVQIIMTNALQYFLSVVEGGASSSISKFWKK
jgi:DNA polymerase I-like protein with 3'-5' exonuclease and polymerase domains